MIESHFDTVANFFNDNPKAYESQYIGRSIFKVENISTEARLHKANAELNDLPTKPNMLNGNNISRVILNPKYQDNYDCFKVYFNEDSKAESWDHLIEKCVTEESSIYQVAKDAIETMAQQVKWQNEDVTMSVNVLRYHLDSSKPNITNLPWHQDPDMLTMTMLLSDYYNQESKVGFSGGELNFSSVSDDFKNKPFSLERSTNLDYLPETCQTFKYPVNGGFVFDNLSSYHKVNNVQLINYSNNQNVSTERRLLSIFTFSDTAEKVRDLADKNYNINLVSSADSKTIYF